LEARLMTLFYKKKISEMQRSENRMQIWHDILRKITAQRGLLRRKKKKKKKKILIMMI
jgi:hypothetical protein